MKIWVASVLFLAFLGATLIFGSFGFERAPKNAALGVSSAVPATGCASQESLDQPFCDPNLGANAKLNNEKTPGSMEADLEDHLKSSPTEPTSEEMKTAFEKLDKTYECWETRTCDLPNHSPRSENDALRDAFIAELDVLYDLGTSLRLSGHSLPTSYAAMARKMVQFPDDDVKLASLRLFRLVPASSENAQAVVLALRDSVDAGVYRDGLEELKRYVGRPEQQAADELIRDTIARGGFAASQEAARKSLAFITNENLAEYDRLRRQSAPRTRVREYLDLNLREYQRMQRGG